MTTDPNEATPMSTPRRHRRPHLLRTASIIGAMGLCASVGSAIGPGANPAGAAPRGVTADFNGDGFDDLAVGAPNDTVDGVTSAGSVSVIYGSSAGLSTSAARPDQLLTQNSPGVANVAGSGDEFGSTVAIADFNSDGFDDLAVGAPGERISGRSEAGAVHVIYGSGSGLGALSPNRGDQFWNQDTPRVNGVSQGKGRFGDALTIGDFNADGVEDLAIGAPGATLGNVLYAGAVHVIHGSTSGLTAGGPRIDQQWTQNSSRIGGVPREEGKFGAALGAGDINGDGSDDLIIGAPNFDADGIGFAGGVHLIYGSDRGLSATRARTDQLWTQNTPRVGGVAGRDQHFGASVAAGDLNGDSYADLIVGAPADNFAGPTESGSVHVIYGSPVGASASRVRSDQLFTQNSSGVNDVAESFDRFGYDVGAADFNADGYDDLIASARGEGFGSARSAGGVHVIYGSPDGSSATARRVDQFWHQDVGGIDEVNENDDAFGWSAGAGDFDANGSADLVVGVPREDLPGLGGATVSNAGTAQVIYATRSGLSARAAGGDQVWSRALPQLDGQPNDRAAFGATAND